MKYILSLTHNSEKNVITLASVYMHYACSTYMLDPRDPCKAGYKEPLINNVDYQAYFLHLFT